jgi:hypothetical protein
MVYNELPHRSEAGYRKTSHKGQISPQSGGELPQMRLEKDREFGILIVN